MHCFGGIHGTADINEERSMNGRTLQVTQAAANIRRLRPPSPYKGKGIRYVDEEVRLKSGKKK